MSQTFIDPQSGRPYQVGTDGVSRWVQLPQQPTIQLPQQPQPKKRGVGRTILMSIAGVFGALIVLGIIGSFMSKPDTVTTQPAGSATAAATVAGKASAKAPSKASAAKAPASQAPAAPGLPDGAKKMGQPAADGQFQFTVAKLEAAKSIGSGYLAKKAQGKFLIVTLTVKNIGDSAQMFDSSSQKLLDASGRQYSADGAASMYLGDANSFLENINPGNSVVGKVAFDIPVDATINRVELHDSMFSGGVEVYLVK